MNRWTRRRFLIVTSGAVAGARLLPVWGAESLEISPQPYFAGVIRALEALSKLGAPVTTPDAEQLANFAKQGDRAAIGQAERILERYTLVGVVLQADGFAKLSPGGAQKTLIEQGWRPFLIRVLNDQGHAPKLSVHGSITGVMESGTGASRAGVPDTASMAPYLEQGWLKIEMYEAPPLGPLLSGAPVEYRVVQLYSRDRGRLSSLMNGYSTVSDAEADNRSWASAQFPRGVSLTFDCLPTSDIALSILDVDGTGCMASLIIRDTQNRVYPMQGLRLAPDMFFHPQIYRSDGETVRLPDGEYTVDVRRGPEYLHDTQKVTIGEGTRRIEARLKRWIDPAQWGWYSGDVHIHGGGCAHYEHPTEGVSPETMIRHVRGEGLTIGDVLSWGPSWYYQKQFFSGHAVSPPASLEHADLQTAVHSTLVPRPTPKDADSMLRYDVEVSGFPSSVNGHLVLLHLKEQDYPDTKLIQEWPSWNLPILKWVRDQGAVAGYAHCGHGMVVGTTDLPNYEIPPMDGIGTQEAIVDVTHGVCDFLAGCDTHPAAELNAWYHMLNCGYRLALVGETDWPCVSDERVGMGRTYVHLEQKPRGDAGFESWIRELKKGRLYCGDGRSHMLEFKVNGHLSGYDDVVLKSPGSVQIEALVAARLDPERSQDMEKYLASPILEVSPAWHLERARIGATRNVPVELIVNGQAVDRTILLADGTLRPVRFKVRLERSSWVTLRILPSSHTYPVFVTVAGRPLRASKKSAQWCRDCVDKLWAVKSPFIRDSEKDTARIAYDHARQTYDRIIAESEGA